MTCDQVRWLLSLAPQGASLPCRPGLRRHLASCADCRSFWQALQSVDEALAARPLAMPATDLVAEVLRGVEPRLQRSEIAPPFSRAFCLFSAVLTLCTLVGVALLLQHLSPGPHWQAEALATGTWLDPAWPTSASAWLTMRGDQAAQIVLAAMAGTLVTLVGVAIGFRASEHPGDNAIVPGGSATPPR